MTDSTNNEFQSKPVYGKNAVAELLKSGAAVDTLLLADSLDTKTAGYLRALAKNSGAVIKISRGEKLDKLCPGAVHQGIVAFAAEIAYVGLEDILQAAAQQGQPPFLVLADGVEDPHNLGALIRSAYLCGAHGLVVPKRGAAAVTPTVLKSSAGAAAHLPIARVANIGESIRRLKKANVFVYCADLGGAPAFRQNLTGPIALVMGSEGKGASPLVKKLCDGVVSLPMALTNSGVDSFNVSVAGGILLYEIFRQRTFPA